jgi:hypothetical protein
MTVLDHSGEDRADGTVPEGSSDSDCSGGGDVVLMVEEERGPNGGSWARW